MYGENEDIEDNKDIEDGEEEKDEDKGNPTAIYEATLENGSKPFSFFGLTAAEDEAGDRAEQDLARMEKEKELNSGDDD